MFNDNKLNAKGKVWPLKIEYLIFLRQMAENMLRELWYKTTDHAWERLKKETYAYSYSKYVYLPK